MIGFNSQLEFKKKLTSTYRRTYSQNKKQILKKNKSKKKISKEKAKIIKFIQKTQRDAKKQIVKREKLIKQKTFHIPKNKSKLTKLFETSAAQQMKSFKIESLIKPNFLKNMLPKNLDTQIFNICIYHL